MLRIRRILAQDAAPASSLSLIPVISAFALVLCLGVLSPRLQAQSTTQPTSTAASKTSSDTGPIKVPFSKVKVKLQPEAPAYPPDAKIQRIQGTVVVEILVGTDGIPKSVKAISGPAELRGTAEDYAGKWQFEPVKVKGQAVEAKFKLTMPFRLR